MKKSFIQIIAIIQCALYLGGCMSNNLSNQNNTNNKPNAPIDPKVELLESPYGKVVFRPLYYKYFDSWSRKELPLPPCDLKKEQSATFVKA